MKFARNGCFYSKTICLSFTLSVTRNINIEAGKLSLDDQKAQWIASINKSLQK